MLQNKEDLGFLMSLLYISMFNPVVVPQVKWSSLHCLSVYVYVLSVCTCVCVQIWVRGSALRRGVLWHAVM